VICVGTGDPAEPYIKDKPSLQHIAAPDTFQEMRKWLATCQNQEGKHAKCEHPASDFSPTRLVKINDDGSIHLYEPSATSTLKWVALSYCWGGEPPIKLTKSVYNTWLDEMPHSELPQTIKDAIRTTRELGLTYFWVDSLCIIQDSEEDMTTQLSQMARIYSHSELTISASRAKTCRDGFLQDVQFPPSIDLVFRLHFQCPDGKIGSVILHGMDDLHPPREPVEERSWTLQEHLLSPRVLVFGSRGVWWTCRTVNYNWYTPVSFLETAVTRLKFRNLFETQKRRHMQWIPGDTWLSMVQNYTTRSMTKREDVFPAISGLAEYYADKMGTEYLAGFFRVSLLSSLIWKRDVKYGSALPRHEGYIAPTWSWASVAGRVMWEGKRAPTSRYLELVGCDVVPVSSEFPFGAIKSARLTVKGRLKEARWSSDRRMLFDHQIPIQDFAITNTISDAQDDLDGEKTKTVWCLEICSFDEKKENEEEPQWERRDWGWKHPDNYRDSRKGIRGKGLVLEPGKDDGAFVRRGFYELRDRNDEEKMVGRDPEDCARRLELLDRCWFDGVEPQTVTIL